MNSDPAPDITQCRICGREVLWIRNENGGRRPIENFQASERQEWAETFANVVLKIALSELAPQYPAQRSLRQRADMMELVIKT